MAIIGLLGAAAIPVYQGAVAKSRRTALAADLDEIHTAMTHYHADHGHFPSDMGGPGSFDPRTLAPLSTEGYFAGAKGFLDKIEGGMVAWYAALDFTGVDSHFILMVVPKEDPDMEAYAISLDWGAAAAAAGGGVVTYEGVYFWDGTRLLRADEIH